MTRQESLLRALRLLEDGDWNAAHSIVQSDESPEGCWLHGIVHVMEGDLGNARYWYRRANRAFSSDAATETIAARTVLA